MNRLSVLQSANYSPHLTFSFYFHLLFEALIVYKSKIMRTNFCPIIGDATKDFLLEMCTLCTVYTIGDTNSAESYPKEVALYCNLAGENST
jgi:hypothetical protein